MNNILANTQTAKYVSDVLIYKINFSNGITIKIYFFFLITQITTLFKKKERKKKDNHSLLTPLLRKFQSSIPFQSLSTCTCCPQYKNKKKKSIVLRKNVIYNIYILKVTNHALSYWCNINKSIRALWNC